MLSVDEVANLLGAAPGSSTGPHWAYAGPVRILVGERDMVERPDAVRAVFAEALPNAEAGIVDGSGHL